MMGSLLTGAEGVGASGETGEKGVGASRLTEEEDVGAGDMTTKVAGREMWKMPLTASAGKAGGLSAAVRAENSKGHMGCHSGSTRAASSPMPASPGFLLLNGSPLTSLSCAAGRVAATRTSLGRLLLLGFPDRVVERRYAQFKV